MKKVLFFILLSAIVISGKIFATENPSQSSMDTTLYENCLELISAMHETACNETYASLILTGSLQEETEKLLLDIRNSRYHVPEAVYQLDFPETGLPLVANLSKQSDSENTDLSPRLQDKIHTTLVSAIALQLNSLKSGTFGLALASAYTGEQLFVAPQVKKTGAYFFVYKDSVPVYISVTVGKDGAVKIQGTYVFEDTSQPVTPELLLEKLSLFGVSAVNEVTIP